MKKPMLKKQDYSRKSLLTRFLKNLPAFKAENLGFDKAITINDVGSAIKLSYLFEVTMFLHDHGDYFSDSIDPFTDELDELKTSLGLEFPDDKNPGLFYAEASIKTLEEIMTDRSEIEPCLDPRKQDKVLTLIQHYIGFDLLHKNYLDVPKGRIKFRDKEDITKAAFSDSKIEGRFSWSS